MRRSGGDQPVREPAPQLFDEADARVLERRVRESLTVLGPELGERVARHLAAAGLLVDDDPEAALAHARYARIRAARVPEVREALGVVAYAAGDFALARSELRNARRMSGSAATLPLLADCERALGRPREALALAATADARTLGDDDAAELAMVVAGAHLDLAEPDRALVAIVTAGRAASGRVERDVELRLRYVEAETLLAVGRPADARELFEQVAEAGEELTDAAERAALLAAD